MAYQSPGEGQRINLKSNSNSVIDRGTVTLQDGTGIGLTQASNTITIARTSINFLNADMNSDQTADKAANDHIKFNRLLSSSGSSISLDTSTPYTNGPGASLGRFTLATGKTYLLYGNLTTVAYTTSAGYLYFQWYNLTAGAYIGCPAYNSAPGRYTTQNVTASPALAIITTSGSTLVELRISAVNSLTQIGIIGFGFIGAGASLQVIN